VSELEHHPVQRLIHGSCGAFLAALTATAVHVFPTGFNWTGINWWVVALCAAFGFLLAWFLGEVAVEILKKVFWWSPW
jgi:hypothetical protein